MAASRTVRFGPELLVGLVFAAAVLVLAAAPALWLYGTWTDPAFASNGVVFFLAAAALFVWSFSSPIVWFDRDGGDQRLAIRLFVATACVRLAGQMLAIDTIGAIALAVDVYALGRLTGLARRRRAIAPLWLAVAFAFSLPLERIVQRLIGYGLQEFSAAGACGVLHGFFTDVHCAGVRIAVNGADVLVDLPCSGAQALLLFGFVFALTAAIVRPSAKMAVLGVFVALGAALIGNILRIVLLASGVALGPAVLGFDVMAQPWHDFVGLAAFASAAPLVLVWSRASRARVDRPVRGASSTASRAAHGLHPAMAAIFLMAAVAVVAAPRTPVDVQRRDISLVAPDRINGMRGTPIALLPKEQMYFQQFGGAAVKANYGDFSLLLTRTTAPLRHLHAPDECLRGLGFRVDYLGMRFAPLPTALYRATGPDGRVWRVETSFLSDRGEATASIAEAVWLWLRHRDSVWTGVERISPEEATPQARAQFEAGLIAALDLPTQPPVLAVSQGGDHAR